jgi:PepSY-associated TM region
VFFILLATTGVILNHAAALRLDSRFVRAEWLLDLYRISAPVVAPGFSVGDKIVSGLGDRLYLDTLELAQHEGPLLGAVQFERMLVVAVPDAILLLTRDGEVIERLSGADGVPAGMHSIGRDRAGRLVVREAHGDYSADLERVEWRHEVGPEVIWAEPVTLPPGLRGRLVQIYRGKGLPLERVLLDVHSGRILGAWGVYLVDAAAVLFLGLVLTGLWMWSRRPRATEPGL